MSLLRGTGGWQESASTSWVQTIVGATAWGMVGAVEESGRLIQCVCLGRGVGFAMEVQGVSVLCIFLSLRWLPPHFYPSQQHFLIRLRGELGCWF